MSRYHKRIRTDADGLIDLYAIAEAFGVKSNPQFHAMKKIMMAGERGHKSLVQDIDEAIIAAQRWKEMVQAGLEEVNPVATCTACGVLHPVAVCPSRPRPAVLGTTANCPTCGHAGRECMCKKTCDCGCLACARCYPDAT